MALVREMVASNGVRVRIFDDLYINASPEEIERRRENFRRVAREIVRNAAIRNQMEIERKES